MVNIKTLEIIDLASRLPITTGCACRAPSIERQGENGTKTLSEHRLRLLLSTKTRTAVGGRRHHFYLAHESHRHQHLVLAPLTPVAGSPPAIVFLLDEHKRRRKELGSDRIHVAVPAPAPASLLDSFDV